MKELIIISGKGGTGKTSITASFAALAENAVLADCDVDAADLHLLLEPHIEYQEDFSGGHQAAIQVEKCIGCGRCADICRFNAISFTGPANDIVAKTYLVDPISCEGCKVCVEFCPVNAVKFAPEVNGQWFSSKTRFGPMIHAKLGIAQENSGKLVTLIRKNAKQLAEKNNKDLIIVDGSPGIGCPVIASITAADMVLIVTEPTLSGIHDLERVAQLTGRFGIKTLICINKADINKEMTEKICKYAENNNITVVGEIPYDDAFTKAQIQKKTLVEYEEGKIADKLKKIWHEVSGRLTPRKHKRITKIYNVMEF